MGIHEWEQDSLLRHIFLH